MGIIEIKSILEAEKYFFDIEAVIFDLDDTLYSEKDYVRSGFNKIAECFPEVENISDELWYAFRNSESPIDIVLKRHGLEKRKNEVLHIYRQHEPKIRLYDGVAEMLERLKKSKKVGIITDGRPEGQHKKINALGINVNEIIITDELGGITFRKPNDKAFVLMSHRLNVTFDKMAYVGDNLKKDFIAPEKLGMKSIYFRNLDGLYNGGL